ncbi:hypothetical protein B0T14DRAFT_565564 [Immersiella caudata]|uniref:Uncharacterized protein n=1 Tax=Immersiella caudata TaxID=314043 RepID=A0AA39WZ25_9PEZI|nr:hypothetical protein B0T14DRAFT_565564 [Immersiella caudata]
MATRKMMHITELPTEILQEILFEVCKLYHHESKPYQRLRKAFRLKLVCKRFQETLQPALFESRMADFNDDTAYGTIEALPVTTHRYGRDKFLHDYIVYHTRTERDPLRGRFVDLRRVAEAYSAETGTDVDVCIDKFAWLILDRAAHAPGQRSDERVDNFQSYTWQRIQWSTYGARRDHCFNESTGAENKFELNINLLSAAAYFNNFPLAKRLLAEGYSPTTHNELLPAPTETAAFAGNAKMLSLLQENLPEFKDLGDGEPFRYRSKVHYSSLLGAAYRGDLEMVKLALHPPSRAKPSETKILDQRYGRVDRESLVGYFIRHAIFNTRDWDVYKYLVSAFREKDRKWGLDDRYNLGDRYNILRANVKRGNTDFVRRLVFEEGYLEQMKKHGVDYLRYAIRHCHDDMVDLIIDECGIVADWWPYDHGSWYFSYYDNLIAVAAKTGSLSLLKKLLQKGARVDQDRVILWHMGFCQALSLEHFDMARYLLTLQNPTRRWKRDMLGNDYPSKIDFWSVRWPYIYTIPNFPSIPRFLEEIWGEELRQPAPKFPRHPKKTRKDEPGSGNMDLEDVLEEVDFGTSFVPWKISGHDFNDEHWVGGGLDPEGFLEHRTLTDDLDEQFGELDLGSTFDC